MTRAWLKAAVLRELEEGTLPRHVADAVAAREEGIDDHDRRWLHTYAREAMHYGDHTVDAYVSDTTHQPVRTLARYNRTTRAYPFS